ncbi:VIR protein [Plasmodium vivax]|uniref:VIR protein n=1 Tax=Plasmodium vivax TaxID=5855 RepID=A0A1G4E823_PLAVI|nr:VIR protein [Plasmodium vivax]
MAKNICNIFISIYNKLKKGSSAYRQDSNYKKDFAFLNYWVNWYIHVKFNQNNILSDFYNSIDSQNLLEETYDTSNNPIYDIEKNELYKMNILYSLYENYSKHDDIIENKFDLYKQSLSTLSTECCPDYIKASYICNEDNKKNNPKFCEKLRAFELKYEQLYGKVAKKGSEFSDNFIKLTECHNPKIITTAVTGSIVGLIPLLGVLYKFTPMGQVLRSKIGILNNDISKNDEQMTNISLIEQENEPLRFKQGTYNIKYQSV